MNLLLLLVSALSAFAKPMPTMHFRYAPNEQFASVPCTHQQILDLPDWTVECDSFFGKKRFRAHVVAREVLKSDKTRLEILYGVTEPGSSATGPSVYHATTAFLHLKGSTSLTDFFLAQAVENDFASLTLEWQEASR